jgi:hypothetical protein
LSPRDDVDRAIRGDPVVGLLPPRSRDEVFQVLLDFELVQLHGAQFRRACNLPSF